MVIHVVVYGLGACGVYSGACGVCGGACGGACGVVHMMYVVVQW